MTCVVIIVIIVIHFLCFTPPQTCQWIKALKVTRNQLQNYRNEKYRKVENTTDVCESLLKGNLAHEICLPAIPFIFEVIFIPDFILIFGLSFVFWVLLLSFFGLSSFFRSPSEKKRVEWRSWQFRKLHKVKRWNRNDSRIYLCK